MLPNTSFPSPPDDVLRSDEPADSESDLRRAYFTNYTREEVMLHYKNQFDRSTLLNIKLPTYRLNYPPEDAQMLIRDQTRSTFLEEIVHPFRESLFVNGFKPSVEKDAIFIKGRNWEQKIIVRYVPTKLFNRIIIYAISIVVGWFVMKEWLLAIKEIFKKQ